MEGQKWVTRKKLKIGNSGQCGFGKFSGKNGNCLSANLNPTATLSHF
jgi:hypothetical protein